MILLALCVSKQCDRAGSSRLYFCFFWNNLAGCFSANLAIYSVMQHFLFCFLWNVRFLFPYGADIQDFMGRCFHAAPVKGSGHPKQVQAVLRRTIRQDSGRF